MTISVAGNSKGELTAYIEEMHIDFNLCDFAELVGEPMEGIEHDKAQIDITVRTSTELSGFNKTKVTLPELTVDNTTPMFGDYSNSYYVADKLPLFIDDIIYYPINEVIEKARVSAVIDGDKVIFGDAVLECNEAQLITVDDEIYVTEDVLWFLGVDYVDIRYNSSDKNLRFVFEYKSESYIEEEWQEPQDYVPQTLIICFDVDRDLYKYNNISYMPVYEFVSAMYEGEFEFGYKSLTYIATKVNVHGIDRLTVCDGDKFVAVNGEKIALSAPAKEVNGVLHIPIDFAESYGYSGYVKTTYFTSGNINTEYFYSMANPMYVENYESPYIDLWIYSDRLPHIENGEVCVLLYDFLMDMYEGEFTFTDDAMEYIATSENDYGITKVSVTVGDKFVMVDDKKIELENEVVRVDGVIRVPISFTEAFGFETRWIDVYNDGTTEYTFLTVDKMNNQK